jgi:L-ascorbate metabolism protein UlaG (beta-lactamase superfamily)
MTRPRWQTLVLALTMLAPPCEVGRGPAREAAVREGAAGDVTARFLANEGVLLADGARAVLLDALFQPYQGYPVPDSSLQAALERASDPFDRVELVLVTHRHGDHFHPLPVARHLAANPRASLLGAAQVRDSLADRLRQLGVPDTRARAVAPAPGTWRTMAVGELTVHALGWPHGGERHRGVEHVAWLVEIGGYRVLHAGDADLASAALDALRLDSARVDLALLPAWMYTSPDDRERVTRLIRPGRVVLIHDDQARDPASDRAVEQVSLGAPRGERVTRDTLRARPSSRDSRSGETDGAHEHHSQLTSGR